MPTKDVYQRCSPRLELPTVSVEDEEREKQHPCGSDAKASRDGWVSFVEADAQAGWGSRGASCAGVARRPAAGRSGSGRLGPSEASHVRPVVNIRLSEASCVCPVANIHLSEASRVRPVANIRLVPSMPSVERGEWRGMMQNGTWPLGEQAEWRDTVLSFSRRKTLEAPPSER